MSFVNEGKKILESGNVDDFGRLLNTSWEEKKNLSNLITNNKIDELYNEAINYGALGGKLLGAGGGGFLLVVVKEENKQNVKNSSKKWHVSSSIPTRLNGFRSRPLYSIKSTPKSLNLKIDLLSVISLLLALATA